MSDGDETTLDAFAPDEAAETDDADDQSPGGVAVTVSVDPAGGDCPSCGARTAHLWVDSDRCACTDCVDWHRDQQT